MYRAICTFSTPWSVRTLYVSPSLLVAFIRRSNTADVMLLVLHLKYMILRKKRSTAPCITKSNLLNLWLLSTSHSARQYFLLIISVPWVVRLRVITASTRYNEDLKRIHVTFTLSSVSISSFRK